MFWFLTVSNEIQLISIIVLIQEQNV